MLCRTEKCNCQEWGTGRIQQKSNWNYSTGKTEGYSNLFFNHFVVSVFLQDRICLSSYWDFFCIILDWWNESKNCINSLVNSPSAYALWIFPMTELTKQAQLKALPNRKKQWEYKIKRTWKHQTSCWFRSPHCKLALEEFVSVPKELPVAFRRTSCCDENLQWHIGHWCQIYLQH